MDLDFRCRSSQLWGSREVFASGPPTQFTAQDLENVFGAWVQERKVKEREEEMRVVVVVGMGRGKK